MVGNILYVYAIARSVVTPTVEGINESTAFGTVTKGRLSAIYSAVPTDQFSQESIDARSGDLDWLGAIGYHHQAVLDDLLRTTDVIPLRAFSLFSSAQAVETYLEENAAVLNRLLDRLGGKREWTLRVEFDPSLWNDALTRRVESLRQLQNDIESASTGKAFLLRKKLEDEKKRASKEAEQALVGEIEQEVLSALACDTVSESRQQREGAFPQINVLMNRDEESRLQELQSRLQERYAADGVTLAVTGPWPPYSFARING